MTKQATVYLVGAGPGDPDLLTVKALRLIQEADVVVYDRLVSPQVLALIPSGVSCISVGKESGNHSLPQEEINELLVNLARPGRKLVRLKGGDPYIFGRGSEEALHLKAHGLDFEVVPGLTAASACSTYAGIPLTHRGLCRSVRFITGHCRADLPLDLDWSGLADADTTLVVYMGLTSLSQVCGQLVAHGLEASTPAAAIESGTTPQQRRCIATLGSLEKAVADRGLGSPVIIVIGKVVSLADELEWYRPSVLDAEVLGKPLRATHG